MWGRCGARSSRKRNLHFQPSSWHPQEQDLQIQMQPQMRPQRRNHKPKEIWKCKQMQLHSIKRMTIGTNRLNSRRKTRVKPCGIIKARVSDSVQIKLEEDPDFDNYQLDDPVRLLKMIKHVCMMHKGNKYICSIVLNSMKQLANVAQGFKEITKNHMKQVKARLETLRNNLNKLFEDKDSSYQDGDEDDRRAIEDKAYEKLGAFMVIVTAEQDLHKTCKDSLQRRYMESMDRSRSIKVYPETYTKARD